MQTTHRLRDLPGWVSDPASGDPRGWPPATPWAWIEKLVGILLTVAAISYGAPFWFDLLSKFTKIRSA